MKITIAIPTVSFGRFSLLFEMIKSIQSGSYKNVHLVIVVDGNSKIYDAVKAEIGKQRLRHISVILNEERRGWVASINRVFQEFKSEYYIYASDDLIFPSNCIELAMAMMKKRFPDGNGVVTLGKKHKCIFGLIGDKWIKHFPNRQVFCPYYIHYGADPEHTQFAHESGRFAFPPNRDSQVKHYRLNDDTRIFSRSSRDKDLKLRRGRQKRGRLWGINFDR